MPANPARPESPGLAVWRAKHARVKQQDWQLDDLWRAACWERVAEEAEADGLTEWAAECRAKTRALVPDIYKQAEARRPSLGIPTPVAVRRVRVA